jgi:hypothetical protein
VREEYMPAMRLALTAPMWGVSAGGREKEGIADVMQLMNDYCLTRRVMRHPGSVMRSVSLVRRRPMQGRLGSFTGNDEDQGAQSCAAASRMRL